MAAPLESIYTVNPDVVSATIKESFHHVTTVLTLLSGVMAIFGGLFTYIWREHNRENREMGSRLEKGIFDLSQNLKDIAKELFESRNNHEQRLIHMETHMEECRINKDKLIVRKLLGDHKDRATN